jgi:hypothetical protein
MSHDNNKVKKTVLLANSYLSFNFSWLNFVFVTPQTTTSSLGIQTALSSKTLSTPSVPSNAIHTTAPYLLWQLYCTWVKECRSSKMCSPNNILRSFDLDCMPSYPNLIVQRILPNLLLPSSHNCVIAPKSLLHLPGHRRTTEVSNFLLLIFRQ